MKISVLTPSYGSGKYLERAIQSVLSQGYPNFEHIVVDAGSQDDTLAILKKYKHLKWVSEPDLGQSDGMNKAFNMSSGEIIVYLNADDEFAPGAFNETLRAFNNTPSADMVVGNLIFRSPNETLTRSPSQKYSEIIIYWLNLFPNNPVSYFYKRKVQSTIGKFPLDDHFTMDIWFLLKAYKYFKIVKIDKVLGTYHSDGLNKTALTDPGAHLHRVVKRHLKAESRYLLPYFYYKILLGKLTDK